MSSTAEDGKLEYDSKLHVATCWLLLQAQTNRTVGTENGMRYHEYVYLSLCLSVCLPVYLHSLLIWRPEGDPSPQPRRPLKPPGGLQHPSLAALLHRRKQLPTSCRGISEASDTIAVLTTWDYPMHLSRLLHYMIYVHVYAKQCS